MSPAAALHDPGVHAASVTRAREGSWVGSDRGRLRHHYMLYLAISVSVRRAYTYSVLLALGRSPNNYPARVEARRAADGSGRYGPADVHIVPGFATVVARLERVAKSCTSILGSIPVSVAVPLMVHWTMKPLVCF